MTWSHQYTPYVWPVLAAAVLAATLLIGGLRRRSAPGAAYFVILAAVIIAWILANGLAMTGTDDTVRIFWFKLQMALLLPMVTAGLCFVVEYAGLGKLLTRRTLAWLTVAPAVWMLLILTDHLHHLVWSRIWFDGYVHINLGVASWGAMVYGYLLGLLHLLVLAWLFLRSPRHRTIAVALALTLVSTRCASLLRIMDWNPIAPFDLMVAVATFALLPYALAVFGLNMFELVSIAYHTVVDQMADAVIVLNVENHVAELNATAQSVFGVVRSNVIGRPITEVFSSYPELLALICASGRTHCEVSLEDARCYHASISPLIARRGFQLGRVLAFREVTEVKQAALIDLSPDAIIVRQMDGTIAFWSQGAELLYGWTRREALGKLSHSLLKTQFPQSLPEIVDQVRQTGSWSGELIHLHKDGTQIHVQSRWQLKVGVPHGPSEILETNVDITERKRAEEELRVAYGQLRTLFDQRIAGIGVVIANAKGDILQANDYYLNLLGCTREECTSGQIDWRRLTPPEWLPVDEHALAQLKERGACDAHEKEYVRRDGSRVPVLISAAMMPGGSNDILALVLDITTRKQAEEALRELNVTLETKVAQRTAELEQERRRLYDVLEAIPAMVCLLTPDYHVVFANRSFREKFGEAKGRHCYEYCFGHTQPCEFCEAYQVLRTGRPRRWECTGPDGRTTIDAHDFPFIDVDGSPLILEMDIDITERKQAQAQILDQQRTLAILNEREMLARELHDGIGQVLAAAHLQADSARELLAKGDLALAESCLHRLSEATQEAKESVRAYLLGVKARSSPEQGLLPVLRQYLDSYSHHYGIHTELIAPPELEEQRMDSAIEAQLQPVIQEALANARRHGGASQARVIFAHGEGELQVIIEDNGRGFDPTAVAARPGFGLRSMRGRAEAVGGAFEVSSRPGQGTRVSIRVPWRKEKA